MSGTIPDHPSVSERFFFDNYGYLLLEDFLSNDLVATLIQALEKTISKRRTPGFKRDIEPAFPDQLDSNNSRVFHLLDEDPVFLQMLDYQPMLEYVHGLFNEMPHLHSTDAFYEVVPGKHHGRGWHIDGIQSGFRNFKPHIPFLQFKVGYILSDLSVPDQGNLTVIPGSHKSLCEPDADDLSNPELLVGAKQICGPPGTAVIFHNALWHMAGPFTHSGGRRVMLYYGYEHPWMLACAEQWRYPEEFYRDLGPVQRKFFHDFVFEST